MAGGRHATPESSRSRTRLGGHDRGYPLANFCLSTVTLAFFAVIAWLCWTTEPANILHTLSPTEHFTYHADLLATGTLKWVAWDPLHELRPDRNWSAQYRVTVKKTYKKCFPITIGTPLYSVEYACDIESLQPASSSTSADLSASPAEWLVAHTTQDSWPFAQSGLTYSQFVRGADGRPSIVSPRVAFIYILCAFVVLLHSIYCICIVFKLGTLLRQRVRVHRGLCGMCGYAWSGELCSECGFSRAAG